MEVDNHTEPAAAVARKIENYPPLLGPPLDDLSVLEREQVEHGKTYVRFAWGMP
ncbi:hypothetical protein [Streptomyces clavifer]|uniref:hypothetical protein n=1 Tax=Streptomyces clavifer TaxID=68188 RepID=UPI00342E695D